MIKKLFSKPDSKKIEILLEEFNLEVNRIKKDIGEKQDYRKRYEDMKNIFLKNLKSLFDVQGYVTENEIIQAMIFSNMNSDIIRRSRKMMETITKIEYSPYDFSKEDLYGFVEECELLYRDIYSERAGDVLSKEDKLSKLKNSIVLKRFKDELEKVKKAYVRKNDIPSDLILKVTEYYGKLDRHDKESFSKDYHYYCVNLYHLTILLADLKAEDGKDIERRHMLISKINKIFFKLDEKERKNLYPKLLKMIDSHEEKLNFYIFGGYEYIHNKDFEKAFSLHPIMLQHYENLDEERKKFYEGIISRYVKSIRDSLKKEEKKEKKLSSN